MSQRNQNTLKLSSFKWLRKWSKFARTSSDVFGNIRKSSENRRKPSEVAGTISEIPSMTRQKSLKSQSHLTRKKLAGILQAARWLKIGMYCDTFMVWRVPLYSWFNYWFTCEKPATILDRGYRRRIPNRDLNYPFVEAFLTAVSSGFNSTIQLQSVREQTAIAK